MLDGISSRNVVSHLHLEQGTIPEQWSCVQEFADWYLSVGMPMMVPHDYEVFVSDDALSVPLFRKGQFQAELYLIRPGPLVPLHEHPGVEVIKYRGGTYIQTSDGRYVRHKMPVASDPLQRGQSHGAGFVLEFEKRGFPLLAFQRWDDGLKPCTVAARWRGKTVGPVQEALIRRFYPDAYVVEGYADVTRCMSDPEGFAYRSSGAIPVSQL